MSTEEWKRIPDFPFYEASSLGRIRSWRSARGRPTPHEMAQSPSPQAPGYLMTRLRRNDGTNTLKAIHRLVAAAFYGPRPEKMVTRHLDGNHLNNRADNLVYGTQAENNADKVRHGTSQWANPDVCPHGHPRTPENARVRSDGNGLRCLPCQRAYSRRSYERALVRRAGGQIESTS